jgi:methyl-accepting chemotaxis protein
MKISTKLNGLIVVASLLSAGLFGYLTYNAHAGLDSEQRVTAGSTYAGPMRDLGEAIYRHKLNMLKNVGVASPDNDGLTRAKDAIRAVLARIDALDTRTLAKFGAAPAAPGLKPAIERILALRHGPTQNSAAIIEAHEATFAQYRELTFSAADTFDMLSDPDTDFVLIFLNQVEVYPNIMMSRAYLIGRSFVFDETASGRFAHTETLQIQINRLIEQQGVILENIRRLTRNVARAANVHNNARDWSNRVPIAAALAERSQRLESGYLAALNKSPSPVGSVMVGEEEMYLAALLDGWRSLTTQVDRGLADRLETNTRTFYLQSGFLAASLLVLFGAMGWGVRGVSRDIDATNALTTRIAQGELDVTVPGTTRPDEIGGLARSIEILRKNSLMQRELQQKERETAQHLSETAIRVADSVDAIRAAASEISQGSNDLAARTERQASALQQTVATMAEISATVSTNAQNSDQARKLAADALARAEGGGNAVTSVVTAMSGIEASSARIAAIIQVMEEISFQTKLLALNAAVEAARAGETGKGFAVVAQEVRSLADRSRQASQQIRDLIAESTREVGQGVQLAGAAGEALGTIIEIVRKVADIAPEIAAGSREQARSIAEINKALGDLDAATQQNAALVEQSSASAASLAEQAGQLVDVVSSFRADGGAAPTAKPAPVVKDGAPKAAAAKAAASKKAPARDADWDEEF